LGPGCHLSDQLLKILKLKTINLVHKMIFMHPGVATILEPKGQRLESNR